jgi:hypothetical protein
MVIKFKKVLLVKYSNPLKPAYHGVQSYDTSWLTASTYNNTNFICPLFRYDFQRDYSNSSRVNESVVELSNNFRELWEQHGAWTRMTIISMVFDLPDVDLVTSRLLQNPVDFGNVLKVYYGDKAASKFSALLKDHLVIAAQLVKAAKAGDNKTAADVEKKWYANADELAVFLASINPYWSQEDWKMMLHTHLMLVKSEAVTMLTKDYADGITVYDELENQALEMADVMTQGIVNQFPERFTE